jgi:hypothetical protein
MSVTVDPPSDVGLRIAYRALHLPYTTSGKFRCRCHQNKGKKGYRSQLVLGSLTDVVATGGMEKPHMLTR